MDETTGTPTARTISTWTAEQWVAELRRKLTRSEEAQVELERRSAA